MHKQHT